MAEVWTELISSTLYTLIYVIFMQVLDTGPFSPLDLGHHGFLSGSYPQVCVGNSIIPNQYKTFRHKFLAEL
uniref:Uncharacterized protein n=1 Tax=Arion vulgaris TaxID=1028688 RepID=A0A0B7BL78_9EUPU